MYAHIFKNHEATVNAWKVRRRGVKKPPSALQAMYDRVSQPDGGFTYQPTTGSEPKEGFALSIYPERSFAKAAKDFTFDDLVKYAVENKDVFTKKDHYLGAWHDPASGQVFLDVSMVTKDAKVAEALCQKHDQIAYFDLGQMKSVTVNANAKSGGVVKDEHHESREAIDKADAWLGVWRESANRRRSQEAVSKFDWQRADSRRDKACRNSIGIV